MSELLPEGFLHRAKQVGDPVTRKILAGDWDALMRSVDAQGKTLFTQVREELKQSLRPQLAADVWQDHMAYVDKDDVIAWADLLRDAIPDMAAALALREGDVKGT